MPEGAIYVGRGTQWGNPFRAITEDGTPQDCVEQFHSHIKRQLAFDLACWCPLDQPCHAIVLLQLANA